MTKYLSLLLLILGYAGAACSAAPATMRLDYYHTGTAATEVFSVDRVVIEPLPWPGNPSQAIDQSNLGKYFFEVRSKASGRVLFSRGFASIYGEWETTEEATKTTRTFSESLRFPEPQEPIEIELKKRDPQNAWMTIWKTSIDPADMFVDRSKPVPPAPLIEIQKMGDPADKVDFLILGEGYTAAEMDKFVADARRMTDVLFSIAPFKEHRKNFNVWALCPPSAESGVTRPSTGVYHDSPLGTAYDTFGFERYMLASDNKALRKIAQFAPYEFIEILANNRTYGGGGIFNLYSTVAVDNAFANYIFVHEFGHHFAGLTDEYYVAAFADGGLPEATEPWEPNATALKDPANFKWADLVTAGTPLPTPWNKEKSEAYWRQIEQRRAQLRKEKRPESEMEALFREQLATEKKLFAREKHKGHVGAFEGAGYRAKGYYRSEVNCMMFSRVDFFCAACRRAIERVIQMYSSSTAA
ncbi:IgA Peptidase M64 [Tahibacter amnicola]|uniref:IgA Peptidase M64 n=1 Tax=Tahibacter amnicola TaxID=2976241 RepID=A0ABY6BL04_9GAMM|nr:IgA Peptidase M64 [Tahibacter amnicola]UXI70545.1 IgA Peptidase M64 [Tahibacter amnicola]